MRQGESLLRAEIPRVHPGVFFLRRILEPRNADLKQAAAEMGIAPEYLERFVKAETGLDQAAAARFAGYSGTTPEFWINMQAAHDLVPDYCLTDTVSAASAA